MTALAAMSRQDNAAFVNDNRDEVAELLHTASNLFDLSLGMYARVIGIAAIGSNSKHIPAECLRGQPSDFIMV